MKKLLLFLLPVFSLSACVANTEVEWQKNASVIEILSPCHYEIYTIENYKNLEYVERDFYGIDIRYREFPYNDYTVKYYRNVSYTITLR